MKKILSFILVCAFAVTASAVPARRGWRTVNQPDGTQIEVQTIGDEYYHYIVNREGQEVRLNENGAYVVVGNEPTAAVAKARRAQGKARRARKEFGVSPVLAEKGLVILVNFKDKSMKTANNKAKFENLLNAAICTANAGYPSAAQYFSDQSYGAFNPKFDVYGPVKLSNNYSYYGGNDDMYATDAVIEACIALNGDIDFSQYDNDGDGKVDVVFVIYAGMGEADGGDENTIWPHNSSIQELVTKYQDYTKYKQSQTKLDGVYLDNYVVASELDGAGDLEGIGTVCHEFGHALGLPDFYETDYGDNYRYARTPNNFDVMDGGAYNGDGHCPPNYSPWERYFFGWQTPENLGNDGQLLELKANGTEGYKPYQITASGKQIGATTSGECYYIENRQQTGWDAGLTGHGLLIWKVNYNQTAWVNNAPNNDGTSGSPLYTIVPANNGEIGSTYKTWSKQQGQWYPDYNTGVDYSPKNTYPGSLKVTTQTVASKPLKSITESNGLISLIYIEEPIEPVDPFEITYMANGAEFAKTTSTGKVVLPDNEPAACEDGRLFVGWTATAGYESETTAPAFVKAGDATAEGAVYYAVYATKGEGAGTQNTTYTFTSKAWEDATNSWTSGKDGAGFATDKNGVQVTATATGANASTKASLSNVTKVVVTYCTNATKGEGSIDIEVGNAKVSKDVTKAGGAALRDLEFEFANASGNVKITVNCTTNSIYVNSVTVTAAGGAAYSNYSLVCGPVEPCVLTGITLNTDNVKKNFVTGETFSAAGLVVKAQYSNCSDKTVTPTAVSTPDMSVAGEKTVTVSYTEEEVTKENTYTITVADPASYTIRFFNNGEQIGNAQIIVEGQQPEVPANPAPACEDYTFAGWWTEELAADNTNAKAWVTDFKVTKDQNYYAIYSKTEEGEGAAFDGTTGGTFTIYSQSATATYYAKNTINSSNKLETSTNEADAASFTFEKVEEGFAIKADGKYLAYAGSGTNVKLQENAYVWTISASTAGVGSWRVIASTATTRALALREAEYFQSFGAYATTNIKADSEYFDVEIGGGTSSVTYYSSIETCSETAIENMEILPTAIKAIRNGQLVIIRDNAVYSVTGARIQ